MKSTTLTGQAMMGFVAGFLSVVTAFFATWAALRAAAIIPAGAPPVWSLDPKIPPFGVPRAINLAFWGGVWGLVLNVIFASSRGAGYWLVWILAGAILVSAMAIWGVPAIKGLPVAQPTSQRMIISAILNGAWGLGAAIWLVVLGRGRG